MKFIRKYFGYYYLLYFFSFIAIYKFPPATPFLNGLILIVAYYLIIKRQRLDVVISLILFSKSLNGFIIYHNHLAYDVVNILCNITPLLTYFFSVSLQQGIHPFRWDVQKVLSKYKFALSFFVLLTVSFMVNLSTSYDLLTKRYLPYLFFILYLLFFNRPQDFNVYGILRFFRAVFFASVVIYFLPGHLEATRTLLESDSVFSISSPPNSYSVVYYKLIRNFGFIWDHRTLAILSYLFLFLTVVYKPKYHGLDILLSGLIVLTTTSRGGMVTYFLVLAAYLLNTYRARFVIVSSVLAIAAVVFLLFINSLLSTETAIFVKSFSPTSKYNAISQRKIFADYSLNEFKDSPLIGKGVGYLSSSTIERYLVVDNVRLPSVADAYWYILLAEMGIIGFVLYVLFLLEVFYSSNIMNIALLIGFTLQLIGTDIPDMRFNYFAILILVYIVNDQLKNRALRLKPRTV